MFSFLTAGKLESFSYFSTDFKIGFALSSAKGFVSLYSGFFVTTFQKNELSSSATFLSWVNILSSSAKVIFSFNLSLSKRRGLTAFHYLLLSATSF